MIQVNHRKHKQNHVDIENIKHRHRHTSRHRKPAYGFQRGSRERGGGERRGKGKKTHIQAQWDCVKAKEDQPKELQIAEARTTQTAKYSSIS